MDQGYDISDYYVIAEEFGTMEEFDELLAEAKKRDMYLIMDLVVNHCSDKHEWFQKALADPDGPYADYFYFRKGKNGNPPSNYRIVGVFKSQESDNILFPYVWQRKGGP